MSGRRRRQVLGRGVSALLTLAAGTAVAAPLTEAEVTRVVAASRDLAPVIKQHKGAWSEVGKAGKETSTKDPCMLTPEARKAPGFAEAEAVVRRHGFADGETYCRSSLRVFATCGVIKADQEHPGWRAEAGNRDQRMAEAEQHMAKAIKELETNPSLSPEQKAQLRQQMTRMLQGAREMGSSPILKMADEVTEADKQTVAPHCGELEALGRAMAGE